MDVGTVVRVKPTSPFASSFPGEHRVAPAPALEEGQDPYPPGLVWLEGVPGAWSLEHLEVANGA